MNTLKTALLMTALTALMVVAGRAMGGQNGMVIAFAFACLMNLGTYWFSDRIVLRMYGLGKQHMRITRNFMGWYWIFLLKPGAHAPGIYHPRPSP
jgi:heat shock protein HtpX